MSKLLLIVAALCAVCSVISGVEGRTPLLMECAKNEVYLPQGQAPNCDTVCAELGQRCLRTYIQAPFGCYCVKGFARDAANLCIPIANCPAH